MANRVRFLEKIVRLLPKTEDMLYVNKEYITKHAILAWREKDVLDDEEFYAVLLDNGIMIKVYPHKKKWNMSRVCGEP